MTLLAYLDPGTGSLVFQILVAGLLTTAVFLRRLPASVLGAAIKLMHRRGADQHPGDCDAVERECREVRTNRSKAA